MPGKLDVAAYDGESVYVHDALMHSDIILTADWAPGTSGK